MKYSAIIIRIILSLAFSSVLVVTGCQGSKVEFEGKVNKVAIPDDVVSVSAEEISVPLIYSPFFSVCDSLLISCDIGESDYLFYISNINSGDSIGAFFRRGRGSGEHLGLNPLFRHVRKGEDITALTYDPMRHELFEWNISESVRQHREEISDITTYEDPNDYSHTYSRVFSLDNGRYLGYVIGRRFNSEPEEIAVPAYWEFSKGDVKPSMKMKPVKAPLMNLKAKIQPEYFFDAFPTIRPDGKKNCGVDVPPRTN